MQSGGVLTLVMGLIHRGPGQAGSALGTVAVLVLEKGGPGLVSGDG